MQIAKCGREATSFQTPFGWAGVAASDRGITRIVLPTKGKKDVEQELRRWKCGVPGSGAKAARFLDKSVVLLKKYFSGERALFDLPLDLGYYTPFQQAVWRAAMKITSGETRSYAWIAQKIKRPRAARAVGQAMGANPVPIIIP
jgi:O6-methylguanine-DNA--protein-cysteine methyltransferase